VKAAVPILRSFDEAAAKAFYVDFLGLKLFLSIGSGRMRRSILL
jgi:hypothetical protein